MSQNVNLFDHSLRARRDLLGAESALALTGATVAVVIIAAISVRWSLSTVEALAAASTQALQAEQAELKTLADNTAAPPVDTALQAKVARAQHALLQHRAALQSLGAPGADREGGFSPRLAALARQSIDGLWLTGMTLQQDTVLLKGRTLTPSLIPEYVQRLDKESSLQGHAFKALDVKRPLDNSTKTVAIAMATAMPTLAASEPATPARAPFVEFMLVGTGSIEIASAGNDKDARR